ncbi:DUF1269 domain-containing family protein [Lactobacillus porci]|jgi:gas vesicle protein|uniref:DUF1269 domain-containing family protein n=1 Tax=Lactobacillus porci TaxID=2012477 RepID=A0A6A8MCU2_9LACO|nr:DUF1269 domain-containing family protein [Lactobacillus porci]MDD6416944.1 DUF1269 domain-containing family protein [Lactobacillus porci]MDD6719594.1 DUF1269 domain-containing family protein [Lactobacillus porci]MST86901.1 DUF1269 domain-containing family protein [Lactobacillus porci]
MRKFTSFLFGVVLGAAAGVVAASLVSDDKVKEVKDKIKSNPNVEDLKEKYDNGTEILKNQLASFPKNVEDDSELKDFDDIVIDDSESAEADGKSAAESASDLENAEKDEDDKAADDAPAAPTAE